MHTFRTLPRSFVFLAATALALILGSAGCKKAAPAPTDDSLTSALHTRLTTDSALATEPIQVAVENGVATLNGTVSNDAARSLAAADAAQVAGIRTVVNNLTVAPAAPPVTAAAPAPEPPPAPVVRETRKPTPHRAKPAPVVRKTPKPAEQATVVPPPPAGENMAAPAPAAQPAAPPAPTFRNVTIPSGTIVPVRITQSLTSKTAQIGDSFSGVLTNDIYVDGVTAIPAGTPVSGRVSDAQGAAHYKGSSLLSIQLTGINPRGNRLTASSAPYTVQGKGRGKNTAEKVGGGAALGAILGGIFGGGKGAAIGAAAGGGVGAGANTITKGEEVQIPSESIIRFRLNGPISVRVSTGGTQSNDEGTPSPTLQHRSNPNQ